MFLIVGLGNPEKKYEKTFHNIGFRVVDKICENGAMKFNKKGCNSVFSEFSFEGEHVIVAKPTTYMNLSGDSVLAFKTKYKLKDNEILVISDDIDLPLGTFRFRESGSGGTHNGLRDIVSKIGTRFLRVRVGIGAPKKGQDLADYVLSNISKEDDEVLSKVIDEVVDLILDIVEKRNV